MEKWRRQGIHPPRYGRLSFHAVTNFAPIAHEGAVGWLIRYNSCLVVLGVMAALLFSWKVRLNWLEGVVIGYLVMLTLYKVGHPQFYLPWLFMVASLPLVGKQSADRMVIILLPGVLLLSLHQIIYQFGSDSYNLELERYVGFIAFLVSTVSIAGCAVDLWLHRHGSGEPAQLRCRADMKLRRENTADLQPSSSSGTAKNTKLSQGKR